MDRASRERAASSGDAIFWVKSGMEDREGGAYYTCLVSSLLSVSRFGAPQTGSVSCEGLSSCPLRPVLSAVKVCHLPLNWFYQLHITVIFPSTGSINYTSLSSSPQLVLSTTHHCHLPLNRFYQLHITVIFPSTGSTNYTTLNLPPQPVLPTTNLPRAADSIQL
ncbi:hypothetical protein OTU49_013040 [Cherax quadricarinatus]|uniref:Ig-like domain-containing protein n=1 Tax=Cherax quadricarinatus TaxID=27406 RepID=A0AAW0VV94_CHEQU